MASNPNLYFTGIQRPSQSTEFTSLSTIALQAQAATIESLTCDRSPFVGTTQVAQLPASFYAAPFPHLAASAGGSSNGLVMVDLNQNSIILPANTAPVAGVSLGEYYYLTEMLLAWNNFGQAAGGSFANPTSLLFGTTNVTGGTTGVAPNTNATINATPANGPYGGSAIPPIVGGSVIVLATAGLATINYVAGFNNLSNPGGTAFGTSNSIIPATPATQTNTFGNLGYLTSAAAGSNYLCCGYTVSATQAAGNATGQFYMYISYLQVNPF